MKNFAPMLHQGLRLFAVGLLAVASAAHASVEELTDDVLSSVSGEDGVTIMLHLEWNANALTSVDLSNSSSISVGFFDAGAADEANKHTYLTFQGFGGIVDMWSIHIDARTGPADVGDYVDITLPNLVAFKQFGFRSLYAQTNTTAEPSASYGKLLLNGSATVTGNMYIWPAK